MSQQPASQAEVPGVRRSIVVPASVAEAFRVYTECAAEWLPVEHRFIRDAQAVVFEPFVGGRFYERGADGTEMTRGTVTAWEPPRRLAVTWRIGPGWRPVFDDEHASEIVVEFNPAGGNPSGGDATEMVLTYTHLERHGADMARLLRHAIQADNPDDTLHRYAAVVARRATHEEGDGGT